MPYPLYLETATSKRVLNLMKNKRKCKMLMDLIRNPKKRNKYILTVKKDFIDIAFIDQSIEKQFLDIENKINMNTPTENAREKYEKDLAERKRKHLEKVSKEKKEWTPCLHDQCPECIGTGIKKNGSPCVHNLSCNCPKCSFR